MGVRPSPPRLARVAHGGHPGTGSLEEAGQQLAGFRGRRQRSGRAGRSPRLSIITLRRAFLRARSPQGASQGGRARGAADSTGAARLQSVAFRSRCRRIRAGIVRGLARTAIRWRHSCEAIPASPSQPCWPARVAAPMLPPAPKPRRPPARLPRSCPRRPRPGPMRAPPPGNGWARGPIMRGPAAGWVPPWMAHRAMHAAFASDRNWGLFHRPADLGLSAADVQTIAEGILLRNGEHDWKVGDVTANADHTVSFAFVTAHGGVHRPVRHGHAKRAEHPHRLTPSDRISRRGAAADGPARSRAGRSPGAKRRHPEQDAVAENEMMRQRRERMQPRHADPRDRPASRADGRAGRAARA